MDEPTPTLDPPQVHRCAVCGEGASYGYGPPSGPVQPAEAWYCAAHREAGERLWETRYRASSLGPERLL